MLTPAFPPRSPQDAAFWQEVEALRLREARLRLILEGIQDHAISMLDPEGAILTWNPAAERITGFRLDEVRGKHLRLLFNEEERLRAMPETELAIAKATGKFVGDGWRQRKDGSGFYASVSLCALRDDDGNLQGFVKVTHDITERIRAQSAVELLSEISATLGLALGDPQMLAQFAANVRAAFAEFVSVVFFDPQEAEEQVATLVHRDPEKEAALKALRAHAPLDPRQHPVWSEGGVGSRLFSGRGEALFARGQSTGEEAVWRQAVPRNAVAVALVARGEIIGALEVGRDSHAFDERDLQLGLELARRLALAIDNARLLTRAQAGESRLHLALQAGHMGAWEWHVQQGRISWSPTLEDIHGIPRGSFGGTFEAYQSDMHPDDRERVLAEVQRVLSTGTVYHVSYRIIRPDGQLRWLDARAQLARDKAGNPIRLVGVCMDVTERRLAQASLEASEQRFRAVFDHALDAMVISSEEDKIVDVNAAAAALLRTSREALVGSNLGNWCADPFEDAMARSERKPTTPFGQRGEMRVVRADGALVDVEYSRAINFTGGHTFAVWRDIAARKRAEEALAFLAEASALLATSLDYREAISNAVRLAVPRVADWASLDVLEPDGTLRRLATAHVDPECLDLAHELWRRWPAKSDDRWGVAQVIRSGHSELHPDVPDALLEQAISDPELLSSLRRLGLKSSMCVPLSVRGRTIGAITLIASTSGRRFGAADLSLAEDLARRVAVAVENARLYESEQHARRAADVANRAKDEFLATVSHELRTPLNAMLGWTRILRTGGLEPTKQGKALETIERNAVNQAQLIEDLLDVSRIISGKLRLDFAALDLVKVIEQTVDSLRPASEAKELRVTSDLGRGPIQMFGDPNRLQQVVWNLLSNAIKFTPRGGRVALTSQVEAGRVTLTVVDTGAGIAPELLPHVFERFKQADSATTRAHGGLGLGLAISRHIVELHGGSIDVSSSGEGKGATFRVVLPLAPAEQVEVLNSLETASEANLMARHPELVGLRVLVVDDDQDGRDLVAAVLRANGVRVSTAQSVADGLTKIQSELPDVLLSDIGLPGEDGYSLIRKLRALPREQGGHIPAAALTAYARVEDRRKALDAGFMMHVAKPVEPAELLAVVSNLMRFSVKP